LRVSTRLRCAGQPELVADGGDGRPRNVDRAAAGRAAAGAVALSPRAIHLVEGCDLRRRDRAGHAVPAARNLWLRSEAKGAAMSDVLFEAIEISKSFGGLKALSQVNVVQRKGELLGMI